MNTKQILLTLFSLFFIFPAYCQDKNNSSEYRKFYLSKNDGYSYTFGTSNFVSIEDLEIPFKKSIFTPGFDGAYFFSKNYGIGMKIRLNIGEYNGGVVSEYTDQTYNYVEIKGNAISLKEFSFFVSPALFAKWSLGGRWMLSANAGVGCFYNNVYNVEYAVAYINFKETDTYIFQPSNSSLTSNYVTDTDLNGISIGFSASAGIHYRIIPLIGIGIDANGFFASTNPHVKDLTGEYGRTEIKRKINQLGVSASIDFYF